MPRKRKTRDQDGLYRRTDSPYWWASYTDASGRRTRQSTGTADRQEAEAILSKWRLDAHRAKHWGEQPTRLFDELMLPYIEYVFREKRQARCAIRYAAANLYDAFSGCDLTTLTSTDVRTYVAQRRTQGVGASTINKEIGLFSAAIGYAQREWGWDIPNPARGCRQREPEGRVRWITRAQAEKLIDEASKEPRAPHLPDLIRIAVHTGMRRAELLWLEWSRVDLENRLIYLDACHTKAGRRRSVPLNRNAYEAVVRRKQFRDEHAPASPWVFCRRSGNRIGDVKNSFASACARAGIEDFHLHDLRHYAESRIIPSRPSMIW
jgi:integrase